MNAKRNKTFLYTLICLIVSILPQPTWANEVYECRGTKGEVVYADEPCAQDNPQRSAAARLEAERQAANDRAVESVKREIVTVKRQLMDLHREYAHYAGSLTDEEGREFKLNYERRSTALMDRLKELNRQQMALISHSFDTTLQVSAN